MKVVNCGRILFNNSVFSIYHIWRVLRHKIIYIDKNISNMNKAAIADAVAAKIGCSKADADRVVETVIDSITSSLKQGEDVSIAGLGIFSVKQRAARTARNPRTGEPVQVPAMNVPKFRAAKALKDAVK